MASNRIGILLVSGKREQLQMAAMVASVGAVSGSEVTVLVSMNALEYFRKGSDARASAEGRMGELLEERKAPPFKTLFEQAVELGGAQIHACTMAMDVLGLEPDDLEGFLGEPMGLTMFLDVAAEGRLLSF